MSRALRNYAEIDPVTDTQREPKPLVGQVRDWLEKQGYPLEFQTASAFSAAGIATTQGAHVRETESGPAREIDVIAQIRGNAGSITCSVDVVIECKWSRDKPWVVFTAPRTTMSPSACIAQTPGSLLGGAVLHCLAAHAELQSLDLFTSGERNGFGARRAFSNEKDSDPVYSALKGVVSKTLAHAKRFDEYRVADRIPTICVIAFPMIVLEGELFEAYFDSQANEMRLGPVDMIRLHWRGLETPGSWISTLDIVRLDRLSAVIARRKLEWETLVREAQAILPTLETCYTVRSLAPLNIRRASRGYTGLPQLLHELNSPAKRS
jgi:hypothetical protein